MLEAIMPAKKPKGKKRWDSYEDYLQSDEWKALRSEAHKRVKGDYGTTCCEVCQGNDGLQVHHWKYSVDWIDDSPDYHVVLCCKCHELVHEESVTANFPDIQSRPGLITATRNHIDDVRDATEFCKAGDLIEKLEHQRSHIEYLVAEIGLIVGKDMNNPLDAMMAAHKYRTSKARLKYAKRN
jgi:hypothetical protein